MKFSILGRTITLKAKKECSGLHQVFLFFFNGSQHSGVFGEKKKKIQETKHGLNTGERILATPQVVLSVLR